MGRNAMGGRKPPLGLLSSTQPPPSPRMLDDRLVTGLETAFSTVWVGSPDCLNRLTAARRGFTIPVGYCVGRRLPPWDGSAGV